MDTARELLTIVGMRISGIVLAALAISSTTAATPRSEPGVFVTVASNAIDAAERNTHVDTIRTRLAPAVDNRHADVRVSKLAINFVGHEVEVVSEINFVLSSASDQIQSIGTGFACIRLAKAQFEWSKVPSLRREAVASALDDLLRKLRHPRPL